MSANNAVMCNSTDDQLPRRLEHDRYEQFQDNELNEIDNADLESGLKHVADEFSVATWI